VEKINNETRINDGLICPKINTMTDITLRMTAKITPKTFKIRYAFFLESLDDNIARRALPPSRGYIGMRLKIAVNTLVVTKTFEKR